MKKINPDSDMQTGFCSTKYAANLLGLSVGTIQSLVDSNKLVAWRTQGGHRRISLQSVIDYQNISDIKMQVQPEPEVGTQVLIVEDDDNTRNMYQAYFEEWNLPLEVVIYSSALEALVDLHALSPLVLLTDLHMTNMDGFEFIGAVRQREPFTSLPIIAITGMDHENIQAHGGLDGDVLILNKPIDMKWLKGFLQGIVALKSDI